MSREEFLSKLIALCKEANVEISSDDEYGGRDEEYLGTYGCFSSLRTSIDDPYWEITIDKDLEVLIRNAIKDR
jgi:hypothetical protein